MAGPAAASVRDPKDTIIRCGNTQVLTYGRVVRPVLGITLAPPQAARQLGQEGVLALEVMPGSPAFKADLHPTYRCCLCSATAAQLGLADAVKLQVM